MPSTRRFYKTIIQITVLSEEEYDPGSLHQIEQDIMEGDCSGMWEITKAEEIDGPTMANLLFEQASDPAFFRLTDDGDDINEDEE